MITIPPKAQEQRLRDNIERLTEFIEASIDAECKWRIDVPSADLSISELQAAVNQVIEAVAQARRERDEMAERLVLIATVERYALTNRSQSDRLNGAMLLSPKSRPLELRLQGEKD